MSFSLTYSPKNSNEIVDSIFNAWVADGASAGILADAGKLAYVRSTLGHLFDNIHDEYMCDRVAHGDLPTDIRPTAESISAVFAVFAVSRIEGMVERPGGDIYYDLQDAFVEHTLGSK